MTALSAATPRSTTGAGSARRVHLLVGLCFYLAALVVFRDVLWGIPSILRGEAVINGDELVPFFNPTTQLFDQARGEFSPLTNGFEFRVRYSFLTTWLRHYKVLPFAVLLVMPSVFWMVHLTVSKFVTSVFRGLSPVSVAISAAFPTALIYMIVTYAKITHFYTLIVGLALMTVSILLLLHALLFAGKRWVRQSFAACLLTLLNPAVHYLVLFSVFFLVAAVTLLVGELIHWARHRGLGGVRVLPGRALRLVRSRWRARLVRRAMRAWGSTVIGRALVSGLLLLFVTVIPYALFVKYVVLRGVGDLSTTVPGDYYFIRDASVSWLHVLSWDLAGIMDKILFGDYLAKVPRYPNVVYTLLLVAPLAVPSVRRTLLVTRAHRRLFGVVYVTMGFAVWASIGYAEPWWLPTFHRSLAAITRALYSTETAVGDATLELSSSIVQVLRFPHRFQLLLFALAPMVMTLGLARGIDGLHIRSRVQLDGLAVTPRSGRDSLMLRSAAVLWIGLFFFVPFWSNEPYRQVFGSGDFGDFMTPFPVGDLNELKSHLLEFPEGKTVVLPPTETSKLVTDANGVDHKFNDKFFIYYLDQPSFYYGLTGDPVNKFEFFLILRGIYYQQDWWINPARDIGIRYLIVNKSIRDNRGVGAEYLPNVESFIGPALERQAEMGFVDLRFENDTYALYELTDAAPEERETLLIDSSWTDYLALVFDRLDLSKCYDFEYLPHYQPGGDGSARIHVYSQDAASTALDLSALERDVTIFTPSSKVFAFNPDIVSSNYYLSPMFRLFLFFSDTKWNRTEIITPGLFGTLRGSFVAVPRPTRFTVQVSTGEPGDYRLFLRGASTANRLTVTAPTLDYERSMEIRSQPDSLRYFSRATVYSEGRTPMDISGSEIAELEKQVGGEIVPLNVRYSYHDLGTVRVTQGSHVFTFDKFDDNPMLVEGLVLIPASDSRGPELSDNVIHVTDPKQLDCGARYEVFDNRDVDYIDPAANAEHRNLSNDELISLAAAGVSGLEPDEGGGLRFGWLVLALSGGALLTASTTVVSRIRRDRIDEEVPTRRRAALTPELDDSGSDHPEHRRRKGER